MSATNESVEASNTARAAKIDELVDFSKLAEQLKTNQPTDESSDQSTLITPEIINILKKAVVAIDDGLKNIYSQGGLITPAILDEIEQPPAEEFMREDSGDDIMPVRGISIGD